MDDMNEFERQVASEVVESVRPPRSVDAMAIVRDATTQSPKLRLQSMLSATKLAVAAAIVALFGTFLLISLPGEQPGEDVAAPASGGPGTFSPAGSMREARPGHTATQLPDGRVLILGGSWTGGPSRGDLSAVVWDPEASTFSPAGSLGIPRVGYTATPLPDGRVLVVGGWSMDGLLASAEIWDPATASFSATGSLSRGRGAHTATALPDGRVVVIGGSNDGEGAHSLLLPEVWDPTTETFGRAGSLAEARFGHTATLLPDGRILVVGGIEGASLGGPPKMPAVVWDPTTGSFSPAGSLAVGRGDRGWGDGIHSATLLADGRVLVVGGVSLEAREDVFGSAEVWDPETASFSPADPLIEGRLGHTATLLPDGHVLIVGGKTHGDDALASAETWNPATGSFSPAASLAEARFRGTATPLPDGRVLIVGGSSRDEEGWQHLRTAVFWQPVAASE